MAKSSTTIDKKTRRDLPPRGKGKKSLMLEAIRSVCKNESEFLEGVVKIGLGGAVDIGVDEDGNQMTEFRPANPMLLSLVINRIEPPLKSVLPMVKFNFTKNAKPHIQAAEVMVAVSDGELTPDVGHMFVQSIKAMIDIEEGTALKDRIAEIEKKLGLTNG